MRHSIKTKNVKFICILFILANLTACKKDFLENNGELANLQSTNTHDTLNVNKSLLSKNLCLKSDFRFHKLNILHDGINKFNLQAIIEKSDNISSFIPLLEEYNIELSSLFDEYFIDVSDLTVQDRLHFELVEQYRDRSAEDYENAVRNIQPPSTKFFSLVNRFNFPASHVDTLLKYSQNVDLNQNILLSQAFIPGMEFPGSMNTMSVAIWAANIEMIKFWEQKGVVFIDSPEIPIYRLVYFAAKNNPPEKIIQLIQYLQDKGFQPDQLSAFLLAQHHPSIGNIIKNNSSFSDKPSVADLEMIAAFKYINENFRQIEFSIDSNCTGKPTIRTDEDLRQLVVKPHSLAELKLSILDIERLRLLEPEKMVVNKSNMDNLGFFVALTFPESGDSLEYLMANKDKIFVRDEFERDIRYYAIKSKKIDLLNHLLSIKMPKYLDAVGPNFSEIAEFYHPEDTHLHSLATLLEIEDNKNKH